MNSLNNSALSNIVKDINQEFASKSKMKIGETIDHPDGYKVHVISGQYLDSTYGRVSNHWSWKRVNPDGSLSETVESGYGW